MTVADLITAALFDLGILQSGEVPTSDDQSFAFARLNDWIDSLKTEDLSVFSVTRTLWTLSTAASYTIGSGATINVDRPVNPASIQNIGYINNAVTPAVELLCGLPMTEDSWDAIVIKSFQSSYPTNFYYQPTFGASGFGAIYPWPIPTASALQGVIYTQAPVSEFATVNDVISLPPGYRRFFRTNLAMELGPSFDVTLSPALVNASAESKAAVLRTNYRLVDMTSNAWGLFNGMRTRSNIYTDVDG